MHNSGCIVHDVKHDLLHYVKHDLLHYVMTATANTNYFFFDNF